MSDPKMILKEARELLDKSIISYKGKPVGTVAAKDPDMEILNYDQVFIRDFAVSAVVFLLEGKTDIIKNFLELTLQLQTREKHMDCFRAGSGLMPASFKVFNDDNGDEKLIADYGEQAIAKVVPIDSSFWWIYILHLYTKQSADHSFAKTPEVQNAIRLILDLCLTARLDIFPTLLVPDGSFMIDRRMGVYGYPLEIQVLFVMCLHISVQLLEENDENKEYITGAERRLKILLQHVHDYYWLNMKRIDEIYHFKVEQFGEEAINKFNIYPETIPSWIFHWMPEEGGYFAGNLGPARMDFRFFTSGNLLSVLFSICDGTQSNAIMNVIEERWTDLVGKMPIKLVYPALHDEDWKALTGADPKNIPWSYHNGGAWSFLLWELTVAAIKTGKTELAENAVKIAEKRIAKDKWVEYYDGIQNRLTGRRARRYQTWSIAGYIAAKYLLDDPDKSKLFIIEHDFEFEKENKSLK